MLQQRFQNFQYTAAGAPGGIKFRFRACRAVRRLYPKQPLEARGNLLYNGDARLGRTV